MDSNLEITIGLKQNLGVETTIEEEYTLMTTDELREKVNKLYKASLSNNQRLDMLEIREKYSEIFWHCMFYFIKKGIPYDFILPYELFESTRGAINNDLDQASEVYETLHGDIWL